SAAGRALKAVRPAGCNHRRAALLLRAVELFKPSLAEAFLKLYHVPSHRRAFARPQCPCWSATLEGLRKVRKQESEFCFRKVARHLSRYAGMEEQVWIPVQGRTRSCVSK